MVILAVQGVASVGTTTVGLYALVAPGVDTTITSQTWIPLGYALGGVAMTFTFVRMVAKTKFGYDADIKSMKKRLERIEEIEKIDEEAPGSG